MDGSVGGLAAVQSASILGRKDPDPGAFLSKDSLLHEGG